MTILEEESRRRKALEIQAQLAQSYTPRAPLKQA